MCTSCLLISALMLFTPAESGIQSQQAAQLSLAQETQVAITEMIQELPKSPDMGLLRQGLLSLRSQLTTAKNDVQAQEMINQHMSALSERISTDPSSGKVTELLEDMLIVDEDEQLIKGIKHPSALPQSKPNPPKWGWLR